MILKKQKKERKIRWSWIKNTNKEEGIDEDKAFEHARHKSISPYQKDIYRKSKRATYDTSGNSSNRQDQDAHLNHSFSVHETDTGESRLPLRSTYASRLATREVEIEKNKVQSKQPKMNTKWFKSQK